MQGDPYSKLIVSGLQDTPYRHILCFLNQKSETNLPRKQMI